jgi:O-antigen/teichoic acid export membrane protein
MSSVRKGLLLSSIERYGVLALSMATTIVTARLMTPTDFGIAILGMSIFGLIDIFRDFGGGNYLIQVDDPTPKRVQTVFTVTLLLALPLFLILIFSADAIGRFYGDPGLSSYLVVISWCYLLASVSSPSYALLCRELRFDRLMVLSLTSSSLNAIVTIGLALMGFKYMSYAWAQFVSSIVYCVLCLAWGPKFPICRFSLKEWRPIAYYGVYDTARGLFTHLGDSAPFLAFGKTLGAETLALYQRAISVSRLPERTVLSGFAPILQPAFSKHAREGRDLGRTFLTSVEHVTVVMWPALIGIALLAHPLVQLLLGSQWTETVTIIQIISLSLLVCFPMYLARPILIALGAVRDTALIAVLTVPVIVLVQIAASFWGLTAVALSLFFTNGYTAIVSLLFLKRHMPLAWRDLFNSVSKSAAVTVVGAVPPLAMVIWANGEDHLSIAQGVSAAALSAAWWLFAVHRVGHPIGIEIGRAFDAFAPAILPEGMQHKVNSVRAILAPYSNK